MAFDIEHFPTSPSALRMLSRVSPVYDRSYVGKWIYQVMGLELDEARLAAEEVRLQAFPETATWGLDYWEILYDIPTDLSKSLEERRANLIRRRNARAPMNPARLEAFLQSLTGQGTVITEDVQPYTFRLDFEILNPERPIDFAQVFKSIKKMKPSHIAYTLSSTLPALTHDLLLCTATGRINRILLPEQPDNLTFQRELITGGKTGTHGIVRVPQLPDEFDFQYDLQMQGSTGNSGEIIFPEAPEKLEFFSALQFAGQAGARQDFSPPQLMDESRDALRLSDATEIQGSRPTAERGVETQDAVYFNGQSGDQVRELLSELPDSIIFQDTLHADGAAGIQGSRPTAERGAETQDAIYFNGQSAGQVRELLPTLPDNITFRDELHAEGAAEIKADRVQTQRLDEVRDALAANTATELLANIPQRQQCGNFTRTCHVDASGEIQITIDLPRQ